MSEGRAIMNSIQEESKFIDQIMTLLEMQFGNKCEVVLHDLTKHYSQTIVDIRNGYITNRSVGGCGSNLGLEVLNGSVVDGDRFNYVTHTPTGRILRSSSIYIRNDAGAPIASICVNYDITEMVQFEAVLKNFNHYDVAQDEVFVQDVAGLLDFLLQEAQKMINKPFDQMTKEEKVDFIGFLDKKGAFLITHSSERVCEILGISRFTFYNYLEGSRNKQKSEMK